MAAGRLYDISFSKVSVSAVQDLFLIEAPSSMAFEVLQVNLGPADGLTTTESLSIALRKYASGYTAGSGGSTPTVYKRLKGDSASAVTALANNTTSTTGTIEDQIADVWNEINGYQWIALPDTEITVEPSAAFAVQLLTAPGAARNVSGTVTIREIL